MPNKKLATDHIWLHNNARVQFVAIMFILAGLGNMLLSLVMQTWPLWTRLTLGLAGSLATCISLVLTCLNFGARVTYASDSLWLRFGMIRPLQLPVEVVEVFLSGEEPIPQTAGGKVDVTTTNVVIRVAERAVDWHFREIPTVFGRWCGGYVVMRGLWCQPITAALLEELNNRLVRAKRELAARTI
jgi:hypothetical protein